MVSVDKMPHFTLYIVFHIMILEWDSLYFIYLTKCFDFRENIGSSGLSFTAKLLFQEEKLWEKLFPNPCRTFWGNSRKFWESLYWNFISRWYSGSCWCTSLLHIFHTNAIYGKNFTTFKLYLNGFRWFYEFSLYAKFSRIIAEIHSSSVHGNLDDSIKSITPLKNKLKKAII